MKLFLTFFFLVLSTSNASSYYLKFEIPLNLVPLTELFIIENNENSFILKSTDSNNRIHKINKIITKSDILNFEIDYDLINIKFQNADVKYIQSVDKSLSSPKKQTELSTPSKKQTELSTPSKKQTELSTPSKKQTELSTPSKKQTELSTPSKKQTELSTPFNKPNKPNKQTERIISSISKEEFKLFNSFDQKKQNDNEVKLLNIEDYGKIKKNNLYINTITPNTISLKLIKEIPINIFNKKKDMNRQLDYLFQKQKNYSYYGDQATSFNLLFQLKDTTKNKIFIKLPYPEMLESLNLAINAEISYSSNNNLIYLDKEVIYELKIPDHSASYELFVNYSSVVNRNKFNNQSIKIYSLQDDPITINVNLIDKLNILSRTFSNSLTNLYEIIKFNTIRSYYILKLNTQLFAYNTFDEIKYRTQLFAYNTFDEIKYRTHLLISYTKYNTQNFIYHISFIKYKIQQSIYSFYNKSLLLVNKQKIVISSAFDKSLSVADSSYNKALSAYDKSLSVAASSYNKALSAYDKSLSVAASSYNKALSAYDKSLSVAASSYNKALLVSKSKQQLVKQTSAQIDKLIEEKTKYYFDYTYHLSKIDKSYKFYDTSPTKNNYNYNFTDIPISSKLKIDELTINFGETDDQFFFFFIFENNIYYYNNNFDNNFLFDSLVANCFGNDKFLSNQLYNLKKDQKNQLLNNKFIDIKYDLIYSKNKIRGPCSNISLDIVT